VEVLYARAYRKRDPRAGGLNGRLLPDHPHHRRGGENEFLSMLYLNENFFAKLSHDS
jgi:hypothetical protein